jgi:hypothetical protein
MGISISGPKFKIISFTFFFLHFAFFSFAQDKNTGPVTVNGDTVEYSTENKMVTATGNVEVLYKGTRLTCKKITVNTETKDSSAEGDVRLEDEKGIIECSKMTYNFQTKAGTLIDADFRSNPYFGRAEKIVKINDAEFIALDANMSTCNFDKPHYRIKSKKIDFFPNDKVTLKGGSVHIGRIPVSYLPQYIQSLKDSQMHVQLMPGSRKTWGAYLLSAWRYNITENIKGRIYLDFREKLGLASGFGVNYITRQFGKGDFKFYYTDEKPKDLPQANLSEFQRYFTRLRHKWDIDARTNLTAEYYKIADEKRKHLDPQYEFLKDYFYREYEKNSQPLSYVLFNHNFNYSSINVLMQKRTNSWFDQLDKLPEVRYALSTLRLGETPLYFESSNSLANFNKKPETLPVTPDEVNVTRIDTLNKLSLPHKLAFLEFSPFIASRQTFYDKGLDGSSSLIRTIFYTGLNVNTKFYRIFNVKSNFLGMDINGLRHIITPSIKYAYNHEPTISGSKLKKIDSVDEILRSNAIAFELSNKLQTKRNDQAVDFADFRVTGLYDFYTINALTNEKAGGSFTDFIFNLNILPYSWMRLDSDATYKPQGDYFSTVNYDVNFNFGEERSLGFGQRYQRKGSNEITSGLNWRLTPKWKFSIFERYNIGHDPALKRGLREQEYSLSRDLHCWTMNISFNIKESEGSSIWLIFKLKAFPEIGFEFDQSYHAPKSGAQ